MRGPSTPLRTHAYVLRLTPYAESDLIGQILTQDRGRISVVARGGRRSTKRGLVLLDYFLCLDLHLDYKNAGDLHAVREAALVEDHTALCSNLGSHLVASCCTELCLLAIQPEQPGERLFLLLRYLLRGLAAGQPSATSYLVFLAKLLKILGLGPPRDRCPGCGLGLTQGGVVHQGELWCSACVPLAQTQPVLDLASQTVLQTLFDRTPGQLRDEGLHTRPADPQLREALECLLLPHLSAPPKSLRQLREYLQRPR
ncbi:MAG: DNA repair protein RecO [Deltaproteobacteria bacterium RIFOXYA12_FULL_61_11]|nr:MAG: DNA repair protein RecO [Deltaproteobacteria bacterium RIFOXYA12_FULL_61_11]